MLSMMLGYLSSGVLFLMGLLFMIQVREGQSTPNQKLQHNLKKDHSIEPKLSTF